MPFHVLISCNLLTENVLYHAMYRYLDKKLPKSGNDILVLSHSPNPTQQWKHSEVGIENRGCTHLRCVLRQVLARYVQNIREYTRRSAQRRVQFSTNPGGVSSSSAS